MADRKLSSVSAVSDMNFVYAETSSGETVKISKADLASVVAGLIGLAGLNNNGLMPKGLYVAPVKKYADPAETITLGETSGFLLVRDPYSWSGYNLYWCTSNQAIFIAGYSGTRKFTLTNESGILKLTNDSDRRRAYEFAYQNIPVVG